MRGPDKVPRRIEHESLGEEAKHVLEEARMVLPGIQALFGFQLVAVFNQRFSTDLTNSEQIVHLRGQPPTRCGHGSSQPAEGLVPRSQIAVDVPRRAFERSDCQARSRQAVH